MGRPKKAAPKHVEPEEESQEMPEEEPEADEEEDDEPEAATSGGHAATMTKADVCRALLAEGITENEDAVAAAKSRFGIEIKPTDFSLYKSKEKAKQGAPKGKPGRRPRQVAETGQVVSQPKQAPAGGDVGLIEALEAMKPLVAQLGAEKVKRLVDLLG